MGAKRFLKRFPRFFLSPSRPWSKIARFWRTLRRAPGVILLPKGSILVDEERGQSVPEPLSASYAALAADEVRNMLIAGKRRPLLARVIPSRLMKLRWAWQVELFAQAQAASRAMILASPRSKQKADS